MREASRRRLVKRRVALNVARFHIRACIDESLHDIDVLCFDGRIQRRNLCARISNPHTAAIVRATPYPVLCECIWISAVQQQQGHKVGVG